MTAIPIRFVQFSAASAVPVKRITRISSTDLGNVLGQPATPASANSITQTAKGQRAQPYQAGSHSGFSGRIEEPLPGDRIAYVAIDTEVNRADSPAENKTGDKLYAGAGFGSVPIIGQP